MMDYRALATDYDGTLAQDGRVDDDTLTALQHWQQSGRKLILITGRLLDDLQTVFPPITLFDWIVAENGALLYQPATQTEKLIATRPSDAFINTLRDRLQAAQQDLSATASEEFPFLIKNRLFSPLSVGKVMVATWQPYDAIAQDLIQEMHLEIQIILNKGAVMLLPTGIDKAAGLRAVAHELDVGLEAIVGLGDAENDLAFLEISGFSIAVANALPEVKQRVDWVTTAERGAGVIEAIQKIASSKTVPPS